MNIPEPYWLQIVAATGATAIIVYGSLFNVPRDWLKNKHRILREFLSCSMCVGFWVGLCVSYVLNVDSMQHILLGFASSAASWLYDGAVGACQAIEVYYTKKNNIKKSN